MVFRPNSLILRNKWFSPYFLGGLIVCVCMFVAFKSTNVTSKQDNSRYRFDELKKSEMFVTRIKNPHLQPVSSTFQNTAKENQEDRIVLENEEKHGKEKPQEIYIDIDTKLEGPKTPEQDEIQKQNHTYKEERLQNNATAIKLVHSKENVKPITDDEIKQNSSLDEVR